MTQRWETLSFLHWSFAPEQVQRLLPPGLDVDLFEGRAWVGLVPFRMHVALPGMRSALWAGRFAETNVRTYVRDRTGRPGIWFFSLDAARLGAVLTARATYRLPYFWSAMRVTREGDGVRYECSRRWPGPRAAGSLVEIEVGPAFAPDELTEQDHFLTARWTLFSVGGAQVRYAHAQHAPWPLQRVEVRRVQDELLRVAGLPAPQSQPLGHFSEGVDVRIGRPHSVEGWSSRAASGR
jgi:uncharacterized protein YqjF (DUF2071 family)